MTLNHLTCYHFMPFLVFLLAFSVFREAKTLDLFVDTSISTISGNDYPDLASAAQALLVPSTQTLKETNNTITLKSNTAGTTQYMPQFAVSSTSGGITIIFEEYPKHVSSISDCSAFLPTILLTTSMSSSISATNIDYFYLYGVNLMVHSDYNLGYFNGVRNVTFDNFCLQVSATESGVPYVENTVLAFTVTNLNLQNWIMIHESVYRIMIMGCTFVKIQGLEYIMSVLKTDYSIRINYDKNVLLQDISVSCINNEPRTLRPFINVYEIEELKYEDIRIHDCYFNEKVHNRNSMFGFEFIRKKATLNNVVIENLSCYLHPEIVNALGGEPVIMFDLDSSLEVYISNVQIRNMNFDSVTTSGGLVLIQIQSFGNGSVNKATLSNFTVIDSVMNGMNPVVFFGSDAYQPVASILIQNFTFSNCTFNNSNVLLIAPPAYTTPQVINSMITYTMQDIKAMNCMINSTIIFGLFNYVQELTVYLIDMYNLILKDSLFQNNVFQALEDINVVEMMGTQVRVMNTVLRNNTMKSCSFFLPSLRVSSFFMINVTITDFVIDKAKFLDYSLDQTTYKIWEPGFYQSTQFLAEERPFMLVNVSFQNVTLRNKAKLIVSNNPMILILNSTFDSITSDNSQLIQISKYKIASPKPALSTYAISQSVHDALFENLDEYQQIYDDYRQLISGYTSGQQTAIFFACFGNNVFSNIFSYEEQSLLSISNIFIETSIIGFFGNTFTNLSTNTSYTFYFISISEINQFVFSNSLASNITSGKYILGLQANTIQQLYFEDNSFNQIQIVAGYYIQSSICGDLRVNTDFSENVNTSSTWIQIECSALQGNVSFENSTYSDITVTLDSQELALLNFLQLQIVSALPISNQAQYATFSGMTFRNIILDKSKQGFIQNVFKSPVLLLTLNNLPITLANNTFDSLSNLPDDNILVVSADFITLTNCLVQNLNYKEISGAIYLIFWNLEITGSTFSDNHGSFDGEGGGLLYLASPDTGILINASIDNTVFLRNLANSTSLIHVEGLKINLTVSNSVLTNNAGRSTAAIVFSMAPNSIAAFSNVTFQLSEKSDTDLDLPYVYDLIEIKKSDDLVKISISDSQLEVAGSFTGNLLVIKDNTHVELQVSNLVFVPNLTTFDFPGSSSFAASPGNCSYGFLRSNRVNASLDSVEMMNFSMNQASVFALEAGFVGTFNLANSQFHSLSMQDCSIIAINSQRQDSNAFTQLSLLLESVYIQDVHSLDDGPVLKSSASNLRSMWPSSPTINISNSNFTGIKAMRGGIYSGIKSQHDNLIVFTQNTVEDVKASDVGGVFYVSGDAVTSQESGSIATARLLSQSQDVIDNFTITGSTFSNISATNGGVYYGSYANLGSSSVNLIGNIFQDMNAEKRGGVLYIYNSSVSATDNNFVTSSAGVSGSIIYSEDLLMDLNDFKLSNIGWDTSSTNAQPVALGPNFLNITFITSDPILVENFTTNSSFIVRNLTSYSLSNILIRVTLMHQDDQISQVVVDESTDNSITANFTFPGNDTKRVVNKCNAADCVLNLSQITLFGQANTIISVDMSFTSNRPPYYNSSRQFLIELRGCVPGELYNAESDTCTLCGRETYSFNISDKSCNPCPPSVSCSGGAHFTLDPGFWRISPISSNIVPCNDSGERCLGGTHQNCSEQFAGPVCLQCNTELGYLTVSPTTCSQCSDKARIYGIGSVILLALLAYQFFVVYTTYKDNKKMYSQYIENPSLNPVRTGAYMVIVATYSQISSVISKLTVGYIDNLLGVSGAVGNPSQQVSFSLQCLYYFSTTDSLVILKLKMLFFVFSPIAKLLLAVPFLLVIAIVNRKKETILSSLKLQLGVTAVSMIILDQPGIIGALTDYLSCKQLDPYSSTLWVSTFNTVECGTPEYNSFKNLLIIPGLAVWGFAVPMLLLLILFKYKKNLRSSRALRVVFGSLYNNYNDDAYYWGILTIFFKISIFVVDSVFATIAIEAKACLLILVVHVYYLLFQKTSPYNSEDLKRADKYVIVSFIWTLSAVLLKSITTGSLIIQLLDFTIAVANIVPLFYLGYRLLFVYGEKIRGLIHTIRQKLGQKKKKGVTYGVTKPNRTLSGPMQTFELG